MAKKKNDKVQENPMKLPRIGDRLMRTMTASGYSRSDCNILEPCVVVYVSEPKNYYTVQFVETGIRESYKLPDSDELKNFKKDFERAFDYAPVGVYVYESGVIYQTIADCARALCVKPCTVSNHLRGKTHHVKGYHIYRL